MLVSLSRRSTVGREEEEEERREEEKEEERGVRERASRQIWAVEVRIGG